MTPVSLRAFVDIHGQEGVAKLLRSSQAAIAKALKSGRLILVAESAPGNFAAIELKTFPSSGAGRSARPNLESIVKHVSSFQKTLSNAGNPSSTGAGR